MHLCSLTLKGFKSFADRTRLDFSPGVSVIVGPNGSGKSNVTDAVLWAMGEQAPVNVRGQSMQDVIFGGGNGVGARPAAEVELVLDNSDGQVEMPFSEISIVRRLDRAGEGEYRLAGTRCRLSDIIEVLSDTGLGKESHSVISQGRIEEIVLSKPRERRLLIEEAAGLGKHRRRRHRAQLKLKHTEENVQRALDVEREARSRLRPLKRQAEAAELHKRLRQQSLEAQLKLIGESARERGARLKVAETAVAAAREQHGALEARLQAVAGKRAEAERALAQRAERHDALSRRAYGARSAIERLTMRAEQVERICETLVARRERAQRELTALRAETSESGSADGDDARIEGLVEALAALERERQELLERELAQLDGEHRLAVAASAECEQALEAAVAGRREADERADAALAELRALERRSEAARRTAAEVGAKLASVNQFLRSRTHPLAPRGEASLTAGKRVARAFGDLLSVEQGCELALAAALGGRLDAALVSDLKAASELLDSAGRDGGVALLLGELDELELEDSASGAAARGGQAPSGRMSGAGASSDEAASESPRGVSPPAHGALPPAQAARPLASLLRGPDAVLRLASDLLGDTWLVESLAELREDFDGVAVTRAGRVWRAASREMRQVAAGGADLVLAKRNERDELVLETERCAQAEQAVRREVEAASQLMRDAHAARDEADTLVRETQRAASEAQEQARRLGKLIERRREAPEEGPLAVRRAELEGELASERRQAQRIAKQREERELRVSALAARVGADARLLPKAQRLLEVLSAASTAVGDRARAVQQDLEQAVKQGERRAGALRECAREEAGLQAELRAANEAVTASEVGAQRLRDEAAEAESELASVAERLGSQPLALAELQPLSEEDARELTARLQRLTRRREQLGPVNPLAEREYADALAHVEELESRRADLETAMRELTGVIRDADKLIERTFKETFAAAAANFEELVQDVFPGGRGRLRLVAEETGSKHGRGDLSTQGADAKGDGEEAVPDGAAADAAEAEQADAAQGGSAEGDGETAGAEQLEGVEIEVAPAGKSTKRLSLLSGGEKSMTALAFMFAVFLARPCPFYILDEVEAALDDLNLGRFLALLRRYADRAQFIVVTHQKRTMEAADSLYGISMGGDGVSKVISRRLPAAGSPEAGLPAVA